MKLSGTPSDYLAINEIAERLGSSSRNLHEAGILDLLVYYQLGTSIYTVESVNKMRYWLSYRRAALAFGQIKKKSPLRPPRLARDQGREIGPDFTKFDDTKSRQMFLDAWHDEDVMGDVCPLCDGDAFTNGELGDRGGIWCPDCGLIRPELNQLLANHNKPKSVK